MEVSFVALLCRIQLVGEMRRMPPPYPQQWHVMKRTNPTQHPSIISSWELNWYEQLGGPTLPTPIGHQELRVEVTWSMRRTHPTLPPTLVIILQCWHTETPAVQLAATWFFFSFWSFIEKTSVNQDKIKFSDNLSAQSDGTPYRWGFMSGWYLVRHLVRLTLGQTYPPWIRLSVRLTFTQTSSQADLWSDVPPRQRHLVAKCDTTSGQVDLFIRG